ncbi:hypothetical protein [Photobacterium damselae]|nr:hypothetical protein [Photobacterium damselae]
MNKKIIKALIITLLCLLLKGDTQFNKAPNFYQQDSEQSAAKSK